MNAEQVITVQNVETGEELFYGGMLPYQAAMIAYAQETARDFDEANYDAKYSGMVRVGDNYAKCGDWVACL
jgi:hypothetical protein